MLVLLRKTGEEIVIGREVWPEQRAWIGCTNPVDPAAYGTPPFLTTNAEKEI
jgi:hypothetical protein